MSLDLSAAVEAHHPVKGGSSMSNIPGGYTGDWVICSCDPGDAWNRMAERIPIADYPAHLLAAAAPIIEAQVRAQVRAQIAAEIELDALMTHLMNDGTYDGLFIADRVNQSVGASRIRRIARGDHS